MSKIQTVNLNEQPVVDNVVAASIPDPTEVVVEPTPQNEVAAETEIDTDELEGLLSDLKKTKKLNKTAPKKRVRKPKIIIEPPTEPIIEPVVAPPVVAPPVVVEPVVEDTKPKRKYVRKASEKVEKEAIAPVLEPVREEVAAPRNSGNLIEEMQRAERALRYQMRKNKMQTLVTQAF
jgi:hypothetical protein